MDIMEFYSQLLLVTDNYRQKSERAGPHPIGQHGQMVKRSLGPKSEVPDP